MSCTPNAGNSRAGLALAARATCTVERQFGKRRKLGSHAPRPRLIVQPRLGVAAPEEPRHYTWAPAGLPRHLARSAGTALRPLTSASLERDLVAVSVSIALSTFGPIEQSTLHGSRCPSRSHMPAPGFTYSHDVSHHFSHLATSTAWSEGRKPARGGA